MQLLLAQSVEQHLDRARLFEHAGYFLAGLAFVVLAGGVAWWVGKRFDARVRLIFWSASLAGLLLFQIVVGTGLLVHFLRGSISEEEADSVVPGIPGQSPPTAALVLDVAADGTLKVDGRSISGDEFESYLREEIREWETRRIRRENVTVELRVDPRMSHGKLLEMEDTLIELGITQVRWTTDLSTKQESQL